MSFLIFKYDPKRNTEDFVSGLAFLLLKPRDAFTIVKENGFNVEAEKKPTLAKMVAYFARQKAKRGMLILQSKIELKTDKHLVDSYGDMYIGFISGKENKASLLSRLTLKERLEDYESIKRNFEANDNFLKYRYKKIAFTDEQVDAFVALTKKTVKPIAKWIDEHSKADREAYAGLLPLIMRDF